MKNYKLFIYLFALALLYILFQQSNAQKKIKIDASKIEKLTKKAEHLLLENDSLRNEIVELSYFDLKFDDYAVEYLEDSGITTQAIEDLVTDTLISGNSNSKDNPFLPLAGMEGTLKIDRIKLINHKWAVADFTDGVYWGQVFYSFQFTKNKTLEFDVLSSHIYPKH